MDTAEIDELRRRLDSIAAALPHPVVQVDEEASERARASSGIDGTAGDAHDIPHPFWPTSHGFCLVCLLGEAHRAHTL